MTDDDLQRDVAAELFWDPKVDNEEIAVSADNGTVTLHGTVGSFRQKREAGKAAERVYGVTGVHNELQVRLLDRDKRDDADLRGDVLEALMLDSLVPMTVHAKVAGGYVTLTGTADWQYQREEAETLTASVPGVLGIDDDITLTSAPSGRDIRNDISTAFRRNARLDADELSVETTCYGMVTLSGTVHSWAEHDDAVAAAWSAPGVTEVDDRILVEYQDRAARPQRKTATDGGVGSGSLPWDSEWRSTGLKGFQEYFQQNEPIRRHGDGAFREGESMSGTAGTDPVSQPLLKAAGQQVMPSAVSKRACWSWRGRSPLQTRAATAVSGHPSRRTAVMW